MARQSLLEHLATIPDPNVERTRKHRLDDILMITLIRLIGGATSFETIHAFAQCREAWLRTFLKLPNGIPSHDTIYRILCALVGSSLRNASTAGSRSYPKRSRSGRTLLCKGQQRTRGRRPESLDSTSLIQKPAGWREKIGRFSREQGTNENETHRSLNVIFREDTHRIFDLHAAANSGIICRTSILFLKQDAWNKRSLREKTFLGILGTDYMMKLLQENTVTWTG